MVGQALSGGVPLAQVRPIGGKYFLDTFSGEVAASGGHRGFPDKRREGHTRGMCDRFEEVSIIW